MVSPRTLRLFSATFAILRPGVYRSFIKTSNAEER